MNPIPPLPLVGITMGDPVGIGPEVVLKALACRDVHTCCRPVVLGDAALLQNTALALDIPAEIKSITSLQDCRTALPSLPVLNLSQLDPASTQPGCPTAETGRAMASYITKAAELAVRGDIEAITTGPIRKASLHDAGYDYPGHTEMLAALTGAEDVFMMLAGDRLRVVLVTIHCELRAVPEMLSTDSILKTITATAESLQRCFGIARPRIAVAGLNPHAGEGGLFGSEEQRIIQPAVAAAQQQGTDAAGPFPPDTVFHRAAAGAFDAVVCMYHDQGLIPLKLLHFDDAVNVTLGLPIIRTSVDHGTAYDIAGTGQAHPASMVQAIKTAASMAQCRKR